MLADRAINRQPEQLPLSNGLPGVSQSLFKAEVNPSVRTSGESELLRVHSPNGEHYAYPVPALVCAGV